ncbi:DOMON domain [Macleaya cordata]|uniref:DOMON domain n=1 Tax=Macleaya cordata TaxID=56857 RepID=A0A200QEE8_MACCD|nr:DOMON domain [Macleaya cordata]
MTKSSSTSSSFSISSSLFLVLLLLISFSSSSSSSISPSSVVDQQPAACTKYSFADSKRSFTYCNDLSTLNSFLHWNYNPSTRMVDIAYRHTGVIPTSTWVAWAINPSSTGMLGSQAFVAFQGLNGTIRAYTAPVTSYRTNLEEAPLSFPVYDIAATFANNEVIIFSTFELPQTNNNSTTVNQLWQDGPLTNGDTPGMHHTSGPNVFLVFLLYYRR